MQEKRSGAQRTRRERYQPGQRQGRGDGNREAAAKGRRSEPRPFSAGVSEVAVDHSHMVAHDQHILQSQAPLRPAFGYRLIPQAFFARLSTSTAFLRARLAPSARISAALGVRFEFGAAVRGSAKNFSANSANAFFTSP